MILADAIIEADRLSRLLDGGIVYLPCKGRRRAKHGHVEPWWDVPLDLHRLRHWPYALVSALTGWLLLVEPT